MLSVQAPTKDFQELNASRLIAWQDFHCTTKNNKFPRTHFLGESYQLTTAAITLAELERLTVTVRPVGLETQNSILRKKTLI